MKKEAYTPRLKDLYNNSIKKELVKELGLKNINQVPKLEKITISVGTGKNQRWQALLRSSKKYSY